MSAFSASWRDEFLAACNFLTRLPLSRWASGGASPDIAPPSLADAAWAFPLVGLVIGAIGGIAYWIAVAFALPTLAAALIAVAATALVTGGLHEDGLADMIDGCGGGTTRDDKLAIMRDSRTGAYGVLALIFSVGLRVAALANIGTRWHVIGALVAAHALGRGVLPAALRGLPPARNDGLGATAGRPAQGAVLLALGIASVLALLGTGIPVGLSAAIAACVIAIAIAKLAQRQIGGQTGDVLGAIEQGAETAALLAVAAWS